MQPVPRRLAVAVAVALLALLAAAGSAAAFSVSSVTVTPRAPVAGEPGFGAPPGLLLPADPAASGAHPVLDITTTFDVTGPTATARDLVQHFGPGIVANPHATAQCPQADFDAASPAPAGCAPTAQVGSTVVTVLTPSPVPLSGRVFNLAPNPGQPAALGIDVDATALGAGHLKNVATVIVDSHDLGLTTTLTGLSPAAPIAAIRLSLWGYAATGDPSNPLLPYFTNPTSCTPAAVSVSATAYDGETGSNSGSYTPTDCATEPFDTSLTIGASPSATDVPSAISVDVKPALIFVPRVNAYVRQNTVTLPPGVLLNPELAASLDACTDAQFARDDPGTAPSCPPSSRIGTVTFVSPILGPFVGTAYFGTGTATDTLRLFLDTPLFGAHIKVIGAVRPDATTGQVTTVFDSLPQVAFTDFKVDFNGAPRAVFTTPATCGVNTGQAINYPWSGGPPSTPTASFTTSYDGAGAPCVTRFRPYFTTTPSTPRSGAATSFTLKFARPDRDARFAQATFQLPRGLIGNLALHGLAKCSLADAAAARCSAASQIGTAQVAVGSGPTPASLAGMVYLTAPRVAGDAAGLSVLVPAKLGPVDLGNVIVGARLVLRSDGGLNVVTDALPQLQKGITTAIRVASISVTRAGFMRNPTSCGHRRGTAVYTAVGGATATSHAAFDLSGCSRLRFAPTMRARLGARGQTGVGAHPPFVTTITQRRGEAAISRAYVLLPGNLATNPTALNAACTRVQIDAGRCSSKARIGTATAVSPFVVGRLRGPVYLVRQTRGLPHLLVQLRGPLSIEFEGIVKVGANGKIANLFPRVPDLPVTSFTLSFHSGRYGILAVNQSLCTRALPLPTHFLGQNGKLVTLRPRIAVSGCPRKR